MFFNDILRLSGWISSGLKRPSSINVALNCGGRFSSIGVKIFAISVWLILPG